MRDIDKLAQAFMDGFTDGNGQWDENFPEYHKEKYRQGVISLLKEFSKPDERKLAFKCNGISYWSDGTASQDAPVINEYMGKIEQSNARLSGDRKTV